MLVLLVSAAHAAFLGGVAFVPVGVGALAFSEADGFSDTLASEYDGWLRPPLTAHGGVVSGRHAVLANAAIVEVVSVSSADELHNFNVGGVRLGADWRGYLWPRVPGKVNLWATAGLFGIVPNSAEADSGWTEEEQTEADRDSASRRARIGGLGAQAGLGAEYPFANAEGGVGISLGARWVVRGFGALDLEETRYDFSLLMVSEAALLLEFTR
jgi:hypothetical protein